jgi:hypothetical protein
MRMEFLEFNICFRQKKLLIDINLNSNKLEMIKIL